MNTINVSVPLTDVNKYFSHMNHLLKAHFELVRLIEVENKLKKHHRAYLHVRERIDCRRCNCRYGQKLYGRNSRRDHVRLRLRQLPLLRM